MKSSAETRTGIQEGYFYCHDCHCVNRAVNLGVAQSCARCGSHLHYRTPDSLAKTWAYSITAMLLLIPANVLPVMEVIYFGSGQPDTIMSGVSHLLHAGMIPIALLVFVASVAVPVLKLLGIIILLLTVQLKWTLSPWQNTVMYRYVEMVGRWSMLDLFMISILVTLVDLGAIATITAGHGATAFAGVVVFTMLAARSFDPRLLWDSYQSMSRQKDGIHNEK